MMESMLVFFLLPLAGALRHPYWPEDFYWSHNWSLNADNYTCLHFNAPQEPYINYWDKNFLCARKRSDLIDPGMEWSYNGPVKGKTCVNIKEPEDPHGWEKNYLCFPNSTVYNFTWSHGGCDKTKFCMRISAPMDQHTWYDNYLCHEQTGPTNISQTGKDYCLYYYNGASRGNVSWTLSFILILSVFVIQNFE